MWRALVVSVVLALVTAACAGDTTEDDDEATVIRVFGNYRGADADAFRAELEVFSQATGIETDYVGTAAFAARIQDRIRDGDPPDVALFPQPAILAEMARSGFLVPLDGDLAASVEAGYPDWAIDRGTVDGDLYGVWYRLSLKSLVWYPPEVFAAQGYAVPTTWDELEGLTDRMKEDGFTRWCLGMEAFAATGWVGTDWIEDLVLRLHGPDVYDAWTSGEIPFTDPRIRAAFELFSEVALEPGEVAGGRRGILSVPALDAIDPMFTEPPGCLLSRQGSFQAAELPEDVTFGPDGDVDVFVLPPMEGAAAPLLASGEIAAAFADSEEVRALMAFLAGPRSGDLWAARGGYNSPQVAFDRASYDGELERRVDELVRSAEVVRFDGADLMPPSVGTGTFWSGMVDLVAGAPLDGVLIQIQSGYDQTTP
jgi:alpha-glucoside transport system substrate-binding protein